MAEVNRHLYEQALKELRTMDLLSVDGPKAKGWLLDKLKCVNKIETEKLKPQDFFSRFENLLQALHPTTITFSIRPSNSFKSFAIAAS